MRKIFSLFAALAMVMSMTAETWTVAGSPASVFGTAWDPANTANVMADQGDGNYKWEKSDLTLAASTIEFKVIKGNAWGEEYPGANYQLKINESGVYTITITFNEGSHEVNAVATKQGAAEVIPTIAIAGDMNGWNTTANEFVIADDKKTASLTLALEAMDYGFKMIIAGGWTSDGNVVTRENNTTVFTGANSDANCTLTADVAGDYTFTWTYATNTLEVAYPNAGENPGDTTVTPEPTLGLTYNVTVPEGTNACYIAGDMNTWTFTEMTKVDDTHYTITIAEATLEMGYKYCSGPDWAYVEKSAEGEELQNRVYSENDIVAAWAAVYDPNGGENPEPNPQGAYYVTGNAELVGEKAWIADAIAMTENEGVYTHTFAGLTTGVTYQLKVTNGTWEQNWGYDAVLDAPAAVTGDTDGNVVFEVAEAGDVVVTFNGTNITLAGNFGQSEDTTVTPEPTLGLTYNVTVPEGTNACYIAGDMNTWTFTEMTKVDDTHYTITIDEATLEMGYKYCSGPDWAYVEKGAEGEELQNRVYSENDVVATWAAVYDPNGGENPEPNPQGAYYVTGNADLVGEKAWIADAIAMTENEGVYTHTFAGLTTGVTYQLKVTNGTWEQNWGYDAVLDAPAAVTGDTDGNVVFEVAEAGDVVVTFNGTNITLAGNFGQSEDTTVTPEPTLGLTYNVTVPEGTNACYIAGDMNTWTFTEMTKVDDTHYTITIAEATLEMGYKYCSGPDWAYVEKSAEGEELQNRVYSENDVVATWAAVYDPNGGENPEPNPGTSTVMLAGEMNDWSTDATPFVAAEDGLTASVTVVLEAQTYQFKVVVDGDWLSNLGEMTRDNCTGWTFESLSGAETNARITADVAGEYTFVWTYADSKLSVVYPDNTTTDLDQVIGSAQPTKVICNGQLMIIRDGMIYTIMGQLIK